MITLNQISEYIKSNKKFRIVFVGDSITSTEWVHPNWREIIEYVLKDVLVSVMGNWQEPSWAIRGINCGFDGSTTTDILNKGDEILDYQPDMAIGLMGGNDRLFGIEPNITKHNIEKIFEKFSEINVVWCTSIPAYTKASKNREYQPYAEATMSAVHSDKIQMINMFEIFQQFDLDKFFTFKSEENPEEGIKAGELDFWHPNQLGNAYIAKIILKEAFGVEFDPEKYMADTLAGEKFPRF